MGIPFGTRVRRKVDAVDSTSKGEGGPHLTRVERAQPVEDDVDARHGQVGLDRLNAQEAAGNTGTTNVLVTVPKSNGK
jgi:hypothetical protein